ncbi:MAG: pyruvate formate lyase family protein [Eubacteriales bacterium]|nr:pyruvate formate lyase family protein [Eubacteriales bacterium]
MKQAAIERIKSLRAFYKTGPVFSEWVSFNRQRRQGLNYMRAFYRNGYLYSYKLRRANAEAYLLDNMEPVINDGELIVGLPDLSPLTAEEQKEYDELAKGMNFAPRRTHINAAHMALDYAKLVRVGAKGLLEEVMCRMNALDLNMPENIEKCEFYECCKIELEALIRLQHRYADKARALAEEAEGQKKKELLDIAEMMDRVPEHPPRTFREGLEAIHFYNVTMWDLFYFGRVDRYLIDLYNADIEAGRITREDAVELYACFLLMPEAYILPNIALDAMVGGTDESGKTIENEVTHIAIEAIEYARSANGKVSLAVTEDMSDELLKKAIRLNAIGCAQPALFNDRIIVEGLMKMGMPHSDAHNYCNTGCVEITPVGKSGIHVVSPYHNLAAMLLTAMENGKNAKTFEDFYKIFEEILHSEIARRNIDMNRAQMERARQGYECARVSCLTDDCLKLGKAVDAGGAIYNFVEPNFLGFSNVVDSLAAINVLVYEKGEITVSEFIEILKKDYADNESLRLRIINKLPHYGTDEELTNGLAKRLSDSILSGCKGLYTYRGSTLVPGAFSYYEHARFGKRTGATPDGRNAEYPLSSGSSPVQGRETKGPTAAMLSTLSWDHRNFMGGIAVNMKFTPSCMQGENEEKMLEFVRTFMRLGGFQLQLNAVDRETLIDAREHPENHSDLLVRVGGFSAYFTKLSPEMQQEIIDRNEHTI